MAFDVTAALARVRFMIGDPSGRSIGDTDLRNDFLDRAYRDWFKRFERRPSSLLLDEPFAMTTGTKVMTIASFYNADVVEHMTLNSLTPEEGLIRSEFGRIRYLQESEGAINRPKSFGYQPSADSAGGASPSPQAMLAVYPIPDTDYGFALYGTTIPGALTLATDTMKIDPLSMRYVARLAAYEAGLALKLPIPKLKAIVAPLPTWTKAHFRMQWLFEEKLLNEEQVPYYFKDHASV